MKRFESIDVIIHEYDSLQKEREHKTTSTAIFHHYSTAL